MKTPLVVKRSDLMACLGLSSQRISQLVEEKILPRPTAHGKHDLRASVLAYIKHLRSAATTELIAERTRLTAARADKEELANRLRGKELIEVSVMKDTWFRLARQTRDALESVPDRIAGIVAAESDQFRVHQIMAKEIRQALEALTNNDGVPSHYAKPDSPTSK